MNTLMIGIKNELLKLTKRKKFKWLVGIVMVLTVLGIVGVFVVQMLTGSRAVGVSDMTTWTLRQMTVFVIPLFVAMIAVDLFNGESQNDSLKNTFLLPISRTKIYVAKTVALMAFVYALLLGMLVTSALLSLILFGVASLSLGMINILLAYLAAGLPLMLLGTAVGLIGQWFKTGSSTLTVSIMIYMILNVVGAFFSRIFIYLPTSYMTWYRYDLMSQTFMTMLLFMVAYIIMFITIGILRFETKEV